MIMMFDFSSFVLAFYIKYKNDIILNSIVLTKFNNTSIILQVLYCYELWSGGPTQQSIAVIESFWLWIESHQS